MNRKWYWLMIVMLPFILVIGVNASHNTPSNLQHHNNCTRYCHNVRCLHFQNAYNKTKQSGGYSEILYRFMSKKYSASIQALKTQPMGLSYQQLNLVVFVGIFPVLMSGLLWGLIRKRNG